MRRVFASYVQAGQHGMWLILEEAVLELSSHKQSAALAGVCELCTRHTLCVRLHSEKSERRFRENLRSLAPQRRAKASIHTEQHRRIRYQHQQAGM